MRWIAALAVALAAAPAALAAPSGNDVVTGHGTINRFPPFVASFRFAAESQPGGKAHGFYEQTLSSPAGPTPFGGITVDITCLEAYPGLEATSAKPPSPGRETGSPAATLGDEAVLGGVVTETTDPRLVGPGWTFWASVRDGHDTDTPDSMSVAFLSNTPAIDFGPSFPTVCDAPLFLNPLPFNPLLTGQILVNG